MEKLKAIWKKLVNRETILYVIFGVGTTLISIGVFALFNKAFGWSWELSNAISWVAAVIFAFVTNKLFVFESKSFAAKILLWEFVTFAAARLLSLGIEYVGLWLMIDTLHVDELISKLIINILVIIINYILSKLIIFKKKKES